MNFKINVFFGNERPFAFGGQQSRHSLYTDEKSVCSLLSGLRTWACCKPLKIITALAT
ncbi:hypothetical protein [Pedobacter jejuensis]|uniref:hypothetical protein n=1 Tax=Pedobacter jejuensis TaxID=1268550 RepID=UPI00142D5AF5|nr:hypothetical protein [Pedobacter jejuensis]